MKLKRIVSALCAAATLFVPFNAMTGSATVAGHDPNGDGHLTYGDAVFVEQFLYGRVDTANPEQSDVDDNGVVTLMDEHKILMHLAGVINNIGDIENNITTSASNLTNVVANVMTTQTRSYNIYNATSGNYVENYSVSPAAILTSLDEPDSVNYVNNNNYVDWTNDGVIKLVRDSACVTCFVIAPHVIATCAHCAVSESSLTNNKCIPIDHLYAYSSTDSTHTPIELTPKYIHVPQDYINCLSNDDDPLRYDYALITVEETLSSFMQFKTGFPLNSAMNNGIGIYTTGFPGSSPAGTNSSTIHNPITSTGSLNYWDEYRIGFSASLSAGGSGSPVYLKETYDGITYYSVVGIASAGNATNNAATRMTRELLLFYHNNDSNEIYW